MKRSPERKRLWLAIVGSIFVHLLVAFSLAAFGRGSAPLPPDEDKPVELTMVDLSATPPPSVPVPTNPAYIETDPTKESPDAPKEKTFESNANSKAASNAPASGDAPLPSQQGKDRPFIQMETQRSSVALQAAPAQPPPQPTPAPKAATPPPAQTPPPRASEPPKPTPLPEPVATPDPNKFAMLTSTPPPALRDPEDAATPPPEVGPTAPPVTSRPRPESPATAYQPEKQETRMTGRITDRGPTSVNAVGTPLGKYQKQVSDAIGSRWYYFIKSKMDLVSIGTAQVEAEIDASGKVRKLRVVSNDANEAFANVCLQSFQEAQIPAIPPDVVATLPDGKLQVSFSFTMYANQ
jgi:outer membrane biosynthesis protein TonB